MELHSEGSGEVHGDSGELRSAQLGIAWLRVEMLWAGAGKEIPLCDRNI